MKIGIMTFWWSQDNYGQLLQCYALQKYLRDLGHDAFLIRFYQPEFRFALWHKLVKYGLHPWLIWDGIKLFFMFRRRAKDNTLQPRHFDDFRNKYIVGSDAVYTQFKQLKKSPPEADLYIVGSDQVWNPDYYPHNMDDFRAFLLDFVPAGKPRVAYAASFGKGDLVQKEIRQVAQYLKRFIKITCREESGVAICNKCGVSAKWVCDPTLLLSRKSWERIADYPTTNKSYVLAYVLANGCDFSYRELAKWATSKGLNVVYVTGNAGAQTRYEDENAVKCPASVTEWLGLVRNAEYIVTNSFHCSLFSILFGRKFGVLPLNNKDAKTNTRIDSLCDIMGVRKCVIRRGNFDALESVDMSTYETGMIEESKKTLSEMLMLASRGVQK